MSSRSRHVVLLGDSIFDNGAYTRGAPDVVTHLRNLLPAGWTATLRAVDGAVTAHIPDQLARVPADATDLVVSVGGNDALRNSDLLDFGARSSADVLGRFAERLAVFETEYRRAMAEVAALELPVVVCTIYNGALPPAQAAAARVGLALFNDVILRTAFDLRAGVIELRAVCSQPDDYANPIEPSGSGGLKIATAIAHATGARDDGRPARVWSC